MKRAKCIIGEYCERHDFVHGAEAESLREGIEDLMNDPEFAGVRAHRLQRLLDRIDARDSLAYLEASPPHREGQ